MPKTPFARTLQRWLDMRFYSHISIQKSNICDGMISKVMHWYNNWSNLLSTKNSWHKDSHKASNNCAWHIKKSKPFISIITLIIQWASIANGRNNVPHDFATEAIYHFFFSLLYQLFKPIIGKQNNIF